MTLKGVLLIGTFNIGLLRQYEIIKLPVVMLDSPLKHVNIHSISAAGFEAAFAATNKLIAMGHRKIAFVRPFLSGPGNAGIDPDAQERADGFAAACRQAALRTLDYRIITAGFSKKGSGAIKSLIAATPRYSAVLISSPPHADQLARLATEAKIQIPRDLSVVVFSGVSFTGRNWSGPRVNFEEFGRKGVELLQKRPDKIEHIRIPMEWNEGNTISAPG